MAWNPTAHRIEQDNISLDDIKSALGLTTNDITTLWNAPLRWSKYKPTDYGATDATSATTYKGAKNDCSLFIARYNTVASFRTGFASNWQKKTLSVNLRWGDWRNYYTWARCFFYSFDCPMQIVRGTGGNIQLVFVNDLNTYELALSDFTGLSDGTAIDLTNTYPAVLITNGTAAGIRALSTKTLSSGTVGSDGLRVIQLPISAQASNTGVFSTDVDYEAYPCLLYGTAPTSAQLGTASPYFATIQSGQYLIPLPRSNYSTIRFTAVRYSYVQLMYASISAQGSSAVISGEFVFVNEKTSAQTFSGTINFELWRGGARQTTWAFSISNYGNVTVNAQSQKYQRDFGWSIRTYTYTTSASYVSGQSYELRILYGGYTWTMQLYAE